MHALASQTHAAPVVDDLKTAGVLAGCAGLLGAATVPVLLPAIYEIVPPEQRSLPLPLPVFCAILAVQFLVVYGLLALAGLRLARLRGREPAPVLTRLWARQPLPAFGLSSAKALASGLLCGLILVGAITLIKQFLPHTLPPVLHPASFSGALLASATASFGEEILCRLFLLNALLRILPPTSRGVLAAVAVSSLLFGLLHAPAAVFLFGGFREVPLLFWAWMISLNAMVGVCCAAWFLRIGIGGAILVHFGTDLVWHVLTQLS
jgi:membrane protease YdiL (CAAX protease family)